MAARLLFTDAIGEEIDARLASDEDRSPRVYWQRE